MSSAFFENTVLRVLAALSDGEDFRLVAEILHKARPDGLTIVWEPDPTRSQEAALSGNFDLVLLDDRPGDKFALTFLRETHRKNIAIPQIVLTGKNDPDSVDEILNAGASDCLPRAQVNAFVLNRSLEGVLQHKNTLELAYESEQRFRNLFETSSEAVLIHADGSILEANPAAAMLFGRGTLELTGLELVSLFSPDSRETLLKRELSPVTGTFEASGLRPDGTVFPVSLHGHPFVTRNHKARLLAIEDQTGLKDRDREIAYLLQRLRQDNERLAQADRLKEEFLSSVTGDLRSPLTAIVGYLKLLKMEGLGPLQQGQRDALEAADKNAQRLSGMVDDLLDMSRLDPGSVPLDYQEISIEKLLNEAIEDLSPMPSMKGIHISKEFSPGETLLDSAKIIRVLSHLLENSVKFTPSGGTIVLSAQPSKEGQQSGWLFSVKDTGVGIPEAERDRIFNKFHLMESVSTQRASGTGLGLSVSKRIVEAHSGHIWAEGAPDGPCAVFKFFLPNITP